MESKEVIWEQTHLSGNVWGAIASNEACPELGLP